MVCLWYARLFLKAGWLLLLLNCFSRVRLCDSMDGSPPGSAIPGILQARTLEWMPFPSPLRAGETMKVGVSLHETGSLGHTVFHPPHLDSAPCVITWVGAFLLSARPLPAATAVRSQKHTPSQLWEAFPPV